MLPYFYDGGLSRPPFEPGPTRGACPAGAVDEDLRPGPFGAFSFGRSGEPAGRSAGVPGHNLSYEFAF